MNNAERHQRQQSGQRAAVTLPPSLRFGGGFTLDSGRVALRGPDGAETTLRPKAAEVLRLLAENAGRLVTRDALMQAAWPDVFVTDDSITQCVAEIRRALGPDGERLLRTFPRRGYLLEAAPDVPAGAPAPSADGAGAPAPSRMSVVVLPFLNRDGDLQQDYLADGITEDLTTILGRLPGSFVVGRGTAFAYKGRAVDVRRLGSELGVRYAVQGSVLRLGGRVRVDAQLLDAVTGAQLWADSLEEPRADLAEVTRMVMLRIARIVDHGLLAAESIRSRAEHPHDPDAADLVLCGRAIMNIPRTPERLVEARRMFERAVALDETYAIAHGCLGWAISDRVNYGWSEDRGGDLALAEDHVLCALAIDADEIIARCARGFLLQLKWRFEEALVQFGDVLEYNRSLATAWAQRGRTYLLTDRPAEAMAQIGEAVRISPRDWALGYFRAWLGFGSLMLGRDEDAIGHFLLAQAAEPTEADRLFDLASAYALTGRTADARTVLDEFRQVEPQDTIAEWRLAAQRRTGHRLYLATKERQFDALRELGMPEG